MTISTRTAQERAEASFKKKEKQLEEGQKAWAEYEANALAVRAKTARLKARRSAPRGAPERAEFAAEDSVGARKEKGTTAIGLPLKTI